MGADNVGDYHDKWTVDINGRVAKAGLAGTTRSIKGEDGAADFAGGEVIISGGDAGAHTANNPSGGDLILRGGLPGSGGTGTDGKIRLRPDQTTANLDLQYQKVNATTMRLVTGSTVNITQYHGGGDQVSLGQVALALNSDNSLQPGKAPTADSRIAAWGAIGCQKSTSAQTFANDDAGIWGFSDADIDSKNRLFMFSEQDGISGLMNFIGLEACRLGGLMLDEEFIGPLSSHRMDTAVTNSASVSQTTVSYNGNLTLISGAFGDTANCSTPQLNVNFDDGYNEIHMAMRQPTPLPDATNDYRMWAGLSSDRQFDDASTANALVVVADRTLNLTNYHLQSIAASTATNKDSGSAPTAAAETTWSFYTWKNGSGDVQVSVRMDGVEVGTFDAATENVSTSNMAITFGFDYIDADSHVAMALAADRIVWYKEQIDSPRFT